LMLFFPRKFLPAIVNVGERNIVNLPTGEAIEFDASTHEIRGGVFSEAAVDVNPDGGMACNRCQVPSKELWYQTGAERFKFSSDAEFEQFLIARCGFILPKLTS